MKIHGERYQIFSKNLQTHIDENFLEEIKQKIKFSNQ